MSKKTLFSITLAILNLGSFYATPSFAAEATWQADWEREEIFEAPSGIDVTAVAPPQEFRTAQASVVAVVENPAASPANSASKVLGLRDGSGGGVAGETEESASIAKGGFSSVHARLSFDFYTKSAHRNGSLLVRLLNRENKPLASFQLYAKGHKAGEIQLNTFSPESDRSLPGGGEVYSDKTWTPVLLQYDGVALRWSLRIGSREYNDLPVDPNVLDTAVERFEIHSGFGAASKTSLYLDKLRFETSQK